MLAEVNDLGQWRGKSSRRWRRLWPFIAISALLHIPMTPLLAVLGLVGLFLSAPDTQDAPPAPPITAIPVELIGNDFADPAEQAAAREAEPEALLQDPAEVVDAERKAAEPKAAEQPEPGADAGAGPDAGASEPDAEPAEPEQTDAGALDAEAPDAEPSVEDAGKPSEPIADARDGGADAGRGEAEKRGEIDEPVGVSGNAKRVADANANVQLRIETEKLRQHPLGARVGELLRQVHQWRDFFGPTGLDPVRDIDQILIAGPQLRDSSEVVAVIGHHVGLTRMRAAVDQLVQMSPDGTWLKGSIPVAKARADRAERYFVLPSDSVVIVTPKSALAHAKTFGRQAALRPLPGQAVATAHVATPWRAFIGVPFRVPKSIKWVKARLTPLSGGGALIEITALDGSPELAERNARELARTARAATQLDLGVLGALLGQRATRFVEKVEFSPKEDRIFGELTLTARQVARLFEIAASMVPQHARRPRADERRTTEDAGGSTRAAGGEDQRGRRDTERSANPESESPAGRRAPSAEPPR